MRESSRHCEPVPTQEHRMRDLPCGALNIYPNSLERQSLLFHQRPGEPMRRLRIDAEGLTHRNTAENNQTKNMPDMLALLARTVKLDRVKFDSI
jgi:hypothetical protein